VVVGRRPEGFIADRFIPITNVDKQSNMYYKFFHGEWRRFEAGLTYRAPSTNARKVHMRVSSDNYFAPNYALGTDWPVEDEVNADAVLNWAQSQALFLTDRLAMDYEVRLAQLAVNSSNVRTVTYCGSAMWWTGSANIISDLLTLKENFRQATGLLPNRLIIPENARRYITINTQVRQIIFGNNNPGMATLEQIAALIGISDVLNPSVLVNTFGETDTENNSFSLFDVWGRDSIWMAKVDTLAGQFTDTWINAFRWTNPALGVPMAVQRYPFDPRRKCYELEVGYYQAEKVVSSDLAVRIIVNSGNAG
jgi:hypothetical protein